MFEKIKTHPYISQFRDVRAIGLAVFGIIALMVTWSGIKAVQTNYSLQKQISKLQQQNEVTQLQNNNQKLQNKYLQTDDYLELAARREFGLAAPGEKVLIVPQNIALAYTKDLSVEKAGTKKHSSEDKPLYQENFQHWIDFFLHRPITQ